MVQGGSRWFKVVQGGSRWFKEKEKIFIKLKSVMFEEWEKLIGFIYIYIIKQDIRIYTCGL